MASAAITVLESPATIECTTGEAVITKGLLQMTGVLANASTTVTAFCKASVTDTSASGVATTEAQAQLQFEIPPGTFYPWTRNVKSVAHKTSSGAAALMWFPDRKEYE